MARARLLGKLIWLSLLVAPFQSVVGQNYQRYAPQGITDRPIGSNTQQIPTPDLDPVKGDDQVLVESLDAVVIVDQKEKVSQSKDLDSLDGIQYDFEAVDSLVFQPGFQRIINRQIGKPITLRRLNEMAREAIIYYRNCKQPIVDIQIPEQRITGGTVHLIVIESRIESVCVQPGCYFDCEEISRWIACTRSGDRVFEPNLETDLLWLNQNPFRRVSVDFQKGSSPGTTDVIYDVNDVRPLRGYLGSDDTGVETLNYGRFFGGLTYGNLFNRGGILGYQFTTDEEFSLLKAHALSYSQALNRRWSFQSYGSWASVSPMVGIGLLQEGESWQLGAGFSRHLIRNRRESANLVFGLDFKSTNNNLEFAGTTIADSNADLIQFRIGYDHVWRGCCLDDYSVLRFDTYIGPGGSMTGAHSAAAFNTIRPGTSPDYIYARIMLEDSRYIGDRFQLVGRLTGQAASERLLFSETLGLGGFDTLRGLDQRSFNADHGWIANFEFGPKTRRWGCRCSQRVLRPYAFLDVGNGYVDDAQPGEDSYAFAITTGVGARFQIGDQLMARIDYGFGVKDIDATSRGDRAHFGVTWIPGPRP